VIKLRGVVFVAEKKKRNKGGREEHHLLGHKLNIMTDLLMNLNLLVILSIKIIYYRTF
jgi:hypothetical protein